ncbi:sterol desaturase family protein [Gilvimarinus sp. SDUM040013]|uniref:Sterol desaturase family protein n=1 Tax=Gilvimarinus gilvus TaxID=3058038 RepID=A0ABU4RTV3_9GAMM|nr:sterol desaturase family protein [Gilvimarinus sp. SDUM040013]MDO3386759.1 sterol desaturase family protein [Gilvimarinus sp. SDUM040013]MDX6848311.1 sterol desaturase family protein [Gilvimarinus sp. SDUM040013]
MWIPLYLAFYDPHISSVFQALRDSVGFTWSFQANSIGGLLFMAFLATLAMEFIGYWSHRLQHRFIFLWRIHATHHHITKMSVARTDRTHPLEFLGLNLGGAIALAFFGASGDVIAVTIAFKIAIVHLNHCNMPLTSGVFGWVFTTAQLHQVHHSLNYAESNKNFGCVLIIWDRVFGTYCGQADVDNVGNGTGRSLPLWKQLALPFFSNKSLRSL